MEGHKAPLYFLDEATRVETLTVPPMAEGIDDVNGEVYLANEAASNLYLLGKFYGRPVRVLGSRRGNSCAVPPPFAFGRPGESQCFRRENGLREK